MSCGVYMSELPVGCTKAILMDVLQKYGRVRSFTMNPFTRTAVADFEYREAAAAFLRSPVIVLNERIYTAPRNQINWDSIPNFRPVVSGPIGSLGYPKPNLLPTMSAHIGSPGYPSPNLLPVMSGSLGSLRYPSPNLPPVMSGRPDSLRYPSPNLPPVMSGRPDSLRYPSPNLPPVMSGRPDSLRYPSVNASHHANPHMPRIIRPEARADNAAIISAIEKACKSPTTNIEEHIGIVLDFIILTDPSRDNKIASIVEDLEEHLTKIFPGCRAELFGSAVTGLALSGDPIDISICDGPRGRSVSQLTITECVSKAHQFMQNFQHIFASIEIVQDEREPMIRFVHNSTRIVCNLVMDDTVSPNSSRQLLWVFRLDERLRLIVVFIKYWAKALKIIDKAKFSGYTMTVLVLFYLQQLDEAIVPALRLVNDKNIPEMAQNITNRDPLRVLIEGFFRYYAEAKVGHIVMSPHLGEVLYREIFILGGSAIPPEMKLYSKIMHKGARPLKVDTPMVLQDPYEVNVNLTSRIDKEIVAEFKSNCKHAYELFKTGSLLPLLKTHCSPAKPFEVTAEVNTSFRAARFLQPNYLVPEPKNEVVLTKQELFQRWLNVMYVILPDFLINFVRLQVVPQEVPVDQDVWEPRAKVARLSGKGNASKRNAGSDEVPAKKWLCKGRPLVCSWTQRKKAAAELELAPSVHPMEREVLISKHLEQSHLSGEVSFFLILKVDEDKEMVRCYFENLDEKPEPFYTVAHALVTLLPLWINNAFEVGFSLRCVTGVYIPGDMTIGASKDPEPYATWVSE